MTRTIIPVDSITPIEDRDDGRTVIVCAPHGTVGLSWPIQLKYSMDLYTFVSNEPLPPALGQLYGGCAKYVLSSSLCDARTNELTVKPEETPDQVPRDPRLRLELMRRAFEEQCRKSGYYVVRKSGADPTGYESGEINMAWMFFLRGGWTALNIFGSK